MRTPILTLALTLTTVLAVTPSLGCADEDSDSSAVQTRAADPQWEPARLPAAATTPAPAVPLVALPTPPNAPPAAIAADGWRGWVDAEVVRVQAQAPEWFDHVMTVAPQQTRSGFLRLVGPELQDPSAAPILLHRYLTANESSEVRAAVVAALIRTRGEYASAVAELLATEPDGLVRVGMVSSLRPVAGPEAVAALTLAFADADPQVRVAAATVAGRNPDGALLAAPLISALEDPAVRLMASRSLGYLRVDTATSALTALLASDDAALRLSSLQAIDRIDPSYAESLPQLAVLASDSDAKVARAATKIVAR